MRVGVYVDGFNLYYGGRSQFRPSSAPGWRWLDIRSLAWTVVAERKNWVGPQITRIVYCTARVDAADNPSGHNDQDIYLRALVATGSVDHIEYGYYVARVKTLPLAVKGPNDRPILTKPDWPVMIKDSAGKRMPDAVFMVSVANREEKGSDVNVATHLTADVLSGAIDAAIVISNDSDLQLPVRRARLLVPVGVINPSTGQTAGALRASATDGVGRHFWRQLGPDDFLRHQLPNPAAGYRSPTGW
jgi:hypothetical protein